MHPPHHAVPAVLLLLLPLLTAPLHTPVVATRARTANALDRAQSVMVNGLMARVGDIPSLEAPIQIRATFYFNLAAWNAWVHFHPTAADIFGRATLKRPRAEHTPRNKNIAITIAVLRLYEASPATFGGPHKLPSFRAYVRKQGLDPDDRALNTSSAQGLGNRAGRDTVRLLRLDGWNADGALTARAAHYRQPFRDYTGYRAANGPARIRFPFRWQPGMETNGRGVFYRQEFVVPHIGDALAFTITRPEMRARKAPLPFDHMNARRGAEKPADLALLKHHARRALNLSRDLTERQMLLAELFDSKLVSFRHATKQPNGVASIAPALRLTLLPDALDWSYDDDMVYGMSSHLLTLDAIMLAWKEKRRIDAVRPSGQTMRVLFGKRAFSVWGGPGKPSVKLPAAQWEPLLRTMPHSEYPSASACICGALVEHARRELRGTPVRPFDVTIAKGSSAFFPDVVPAHRTVLRLKSLRQWDHLCGKSREWAGVHFAPSVPAGRALCSDLAGRAHDVTARMLKGKHSATWMSWLPHDVHRFWEE